jgi:uncharacterized membrane protein YgcG
LCFATLFVFVFIYVLLSAIIVFTKKIKGRSNVKSVLAEAHVSPAIRKKVLAAAFPTTRYRRDGTFGGAGIGGGYGVGGGDCGGGGGGSC